jgi:hypothetical protein
MLSTSRSTYQKETYTVTKGKLEPKEKIRSQIHVFCFANTASNLLDTPSQILTKLSVFWGGDASDERPKITGYVKFQAISFPHPRAEQR